jgi:hypothetical protein
MSIHCHKPNYQCPSCQSFLLPYKKGILCPNCDKVINDEDTTEYLNVVDFIASSMKLHKWKHGSYFPGAFATFDFMDNVQGIIYQIFDSMEEAKPEDKEEYLISMLDKMGWGNQKYLKTHIKDIALEILKIYIAENFSDIKRRELGNGDCDLRKSSTLSRKEVPQIDTNSADYKRKLAIWKKKAEKRRNVKMMISFFLISSFVPLMMDTYFIEKLLKEGALIISIVRIALLGLWLSFSRLSYLAYEEREVGDRIDDQEYILARVKDNKICSIIFQVCAIVLFTIFIFYNERFF